VAVVRERRNAGDALSPRGVEQPRHALAEVVVRERLVDDGGVETVDGRDLGECVAVADVAPVDPQRVEDGLVEVEPRVGLVGAGRPRIVRSLVEPPPINTTKSYLRACPTTTRSTRPPR